METNGETTKEPKETPRKRRFSCLQVIIILGIGMLVTALVSVWAVRAYVFPSELSAATLSAREQETLDAKLQRIEAAGSGGGSAGPEAYSEEGASREIRLNENELNALIARNTELADRLAIDLSDDLATAKLLIPLDDDFPVLGGQTVRVTVGLEVTYSQGRPTAVLKGVSLMGVPVPNAWLGNLKDVDLIGEFVGDQGLWSTFAAGVEEIEIRDGELKLELKE